MELTGLDVMSSAEPSEADDSSDSVEEIDSVDCLVGTRLTTSFGPGTIQELREYEDMMYCTVRLSSFGTVSLAQTTVEAILRKEKKLGLRQRLIPPPKPGTSSRHQNVTGSIRMFNPAKGWGFIVCDEFAGDVFLHSKHMLGNVPREYIGHFQSSQDGHQVKFDLDLQHGKRPQALNVRVVNLAEQEVTVYPKRRSARNRTDKVGAADHDVDQLGEETKEEIQAALDEAESCSSAELDVADDADLWASSADFHDSATPADADAAAGDASVEEDGDAAARRQPRYHGSSQAPGEKDQNFPLSANLALNDRNNNKGVLRMRGLPFTVTPGNIADFFEGFGVRPEDVTLGQRADGSPSGEACVLFVRDEIAEKARKEKHMQHMGHRYIELFNVKDEDGMDSVQLPRASRAEQPPGVVRPALEVGPIAPIPTRSAFKATGPNVGGSAGAASWRHAAPPTPAPPPGAAAAAAAQAAHVAADLQMPILPAQADAAGGAGGNPDAQAYDHYFQYFQQAYAAAVASQAVQAYASAAAQSYQQQQVELAQQTAQQMGQQPAGGTEGVHQQLEQQPPTLDPYASAVPAVAAEAAAAVATPTAVPATPPAQTKRTDTQAHSQEQAHYGQQSAYEPDAPNMGYEMGAPGLEEVSAPQQWRWQHYNVI